MKTALVTREKDAFYQDAFFQTARPSGPGPTAEFPTPDTTPLLYKKARKKTKAIPREISKIPPGTDIHRARIGHQLLGFELTPQAMDVAGVLEAAGPGGKHLHFKVVILEPRRSGKTTSIWAVAIGRCLTIPGYKVLYTAQDGTRARELLTREVFPHLRALQKRTGQGYDHYGMRLLKGVGAEQVVFDNESFITPIPPDADSFRSKAADLIIIDEAGTITDEIGNIVISAAMPLLDTRDDPQLVITGTAAETQTGLLWSEIQDPTNSRVIYASSQDEAQAFIDAAEFNEELIARVHPGYGSLSSAKVIQTNFNWHKLKDELELFAREYLGYFPEQGSNGAIPIAKWNASGLDGPVPPRPARPGLAFEVGTDQEDAALVAAWRDPEGHAYIDLVWYAEGTNWLTSKVQAAATKHRVPIHYDQVLSTSSDFAQLLTRLRTRIAPLGLQEVKAATARIRREIGNGNLYHWKDQTKLTQSALGAVWRNIGESRLFGRSKAEHTAAPIVAATLALWAYDQTTRTPGTTTGITHTKS
ncbi:MAG: hypothetical protein LBK28_06370 [Propionibacteriaceae bacterium]|jgi:hypothetical protein|nr:hypothetical protein [Propionibacteriaceae bacterium]